MAMRANPTERIGTSGQSKVKAKFEDLGWGANPNDDHDLGTDLWLHARDARRFDLGALVGAQVKASDDEDGSYFSRPTKAGEPEGWWYSESDQDHFKYWTEHAVPHLLVLHNHETDLSYWVHVTKDTVVDTGQGAKILVPASQTLDKDHRDDLITIATTQRLGTTWAGSAWSSQNRIYREDRLRYAVIAPRLIAPHPNAMPDTLEPEQAIALLTQMRLYDLDSQVHPEYLSLDLARQHGDWRWRLYTALHDYLRAGDPLSLGPLMESSLAPHELAALSAIQAACFVETGQLDKAQAVLSKALAPDDVSLADNLWLQIQHARCLRDLGDVSEAQRIALEIQDQRGRAAEDPTVLAICGAAADIVFSTSPLGSGDFAGTVTGRDTPTAWWRSQVMSSGLIDHLEGDFKHWSNDESVVFGKSDKAWLNLRAASLMSGFAGDHASWRNSLSLLARRELLTFDEEGPIDQVSSALHDLRWAGDKKSLKQATRRAVLDGPAAAARQVGQEIDMGRSTRTSIHCDLAFLTQAADVLDAQTADRAARWALETIAAPRPFLDRYGPSFDLTQVVVGLLKALVPSVSEETERQIIEHVLALPAQEDHHTALLYARVLRAIEPAAWSPQDIERLCTRPDNDHWELRSAIDYLLAPRDGDVQERLTEQIRSGSLQALSRIHDVRGISSDDVKAVIETLREKLGQQLKMARSGVWDEGMDLGQTLTLLNMWHPEAADWNPVLELLAEPATAPHHLTGTLSLLSQRPDRVPPAVKTRMIPTLRAWMTRPSLKAPISEVDVRGQAADALNAMEPGSVTNQQLWVLMKGTRDQRASAALVIARRKDSADINLLVSFTQDKDVKVRATVANCLAGWIKDGINTAETADLLESLLQDPGTRLARSVSGTLVYSQPEILQKCAPLLTLLEDHISADVRRDIKHLFRTSGRPEAAPSKAADSHS